MGVIVGLDRCVWSCGCRVSTAQRESGNGRSGCGFCGVARMFATTATMAGGPERLTFCTTSHGDECAEHWWVFYVASSLI